MYPSEKCSKNINANCILASLLVGEKCFSICKVFDFQNRDLAIDINGLGRCIPQACISCRVVCIRDLNQIIIACDGHLANLLMEGTVVCYWYKL